VVSFSLNFNEGVLSTIFSYLRPEELGSPALVCWKWGEAASGELVWEGFDLELFSMNNFRSENSPSEN